MTRLFIFVAIFIAAFVSGVVASLYVSKTFVDNSLEFTVMQQEMFNHPSNEHRETSLWVSTALTIIEKTRESDETSLYQYACLLLQFNYPKLNPESVKDTGQYEGALEQKGKAERELKLLEESEKCI
ncbi:hypothetical protein [Teredinibacter purpureus]|uniref:hypothetical protein n=1 Tax=Teredinibacter purpureus TaxID=2731756 RepID=UPI0005F7B7E0|nr:hypothetical protein [Teredinibacter purpureus]